MSGLRPTDTSLLFSKNDNEDPRLGECVQRVSESDLQSTQRQQFDVAILGYADDEGIILNGGRPGAHQGPVEIRKVLYKMTPHPQSPRLPKICDLGDVDPTTAPLEKRHETGRNLIKTLCQHNHRWISLGGGHDYGYCDAAGFIEIHQDEAVVLNFDSHMDVRPTNKGFNSGTPYRRILEEFSDRVDFAEIGIQNHCNSKFHIEWAQKQGAEVITLDHVLHEGLQNTLKTYLLGKERKKIFLSVDIDAFTSNEAPGCSQSWTTGFYAREFLESLKWLIQNFDVRGLGIYEVSPPLDQDNRTSKLAALIAYQFLSGSMLKI